MKLYQYAAFYTPSKEERNKGEKDRIIVEPKVCLANDDSAATLIAARALPAEYEERLDKVTVAVRPF